MEFYIWRLLDKDGEVVNEGVRDEAVDAFIEDIVPDEHNNSCDRCFWDVQDYIDKYLDGKYTFQYARMEIEWPE